MIGISLLMGQLCMDHYIVNGRLSLIATFRRSWAQTIRLWAGCPKSTSAARVGTSRFDAGVGIYCHAVLLS